jgi:hypothetical protein
MRFFLILLVILTLSSFSCVRNSNITSSTTSSEQPLPSSSQIMMNNPDLTETSKVLYVGTKMWMEAPKGHVGYDDAQKLWQVIRSLNLIQDTLTPNPFGGQRVSFTGIRLRKADGSAFAPFHCAELKTLREHPLVMYAGFWYKGGIMYNQFYLSVPTDSAKTFPVQTYIDKYQLVKIHDAWQEPYYYWVLNFPNDIGIGLLESLAEIEKSKQGIKAEPSLMSFADTDYPDEGSDK